MGRGASADLNRPPDKLSTGNQGAEIELQRLFSSQNSRDDLLKEFESSGDPPFAKVFPKYQNGGVLSCGICTSRSFGRQFSQTVRLKSKEI